MEAQEGSTVTSKEFDTAPRSPTSQVLNSSNVPAPSKYPKPSNDNNTVSHCLARRTDLAPTSPSRALKFSLNWSGIEQSVETQEGPTVTSKEFETVHAWPRALSYT